MNICFKSEYEDSGLLYNHCVKTEQSPQDYRPHFHDQYEIIFLKEGSISYLISDAVCSTQKNSLIFTRPGQLHSIRIDEDIPYDRCNLLVSGSLLPSSLLAKIPNDLHVISFDNDLLVIQLFEKMDLYCEKLSGNDLGRILRALTEEVLLNVLIRLDTQKEPPDIHPLLLRAVNYIDENLLSVQNIDAMCSELSVSKSYLYRLFQTNLHTTPKQYIAERRLNLARREILLGAKATAIYTQCGFSDYSAFFRAYKKHFGYSPAVTPKSG